MAPTTLTNPCTTDILLHNVLINCAQFMDYIAGFPDVWVCKRNEIAQHWLKVHPFSSMMGNGGAQDRTPALVSKL